MSLVNLTKVAPLAAKAFNPDAELGVRGGGRTIEASLTINNIKVPAFTVKAKRSGGGYRGRRGNHLRFGCYLVAGNRYILTLYEDDADKLNGTISTGGGAGGYGATETGAITSKINSTNLGNYVVAKLIRNYTNVDFTGAGGVAASDALPLTGGRDRH